MTTTTSLTEGEKRRRERIARTLRRYHARQRERRRIRPTHVDKWLRKREVADALRPILEARALHAEAMVQDLGGPDELTAMQKGVLEGWLQAQVAADAEFLRFVRDQDLTALERLATFLNTARANLSALGLHRRAKEIPDLQAYLAERGDAAEDRTGGAKTDSSDSQAGDDGEVAPEESQ